MNWILGIAFALLILLSTGCMAALVHLVHMRREADAEEPGITGITSFFRPPAKITEIARKIGVVRNA